MLGCKIVTLSATLLSSSVSAIEEDIKYLDNGVDRIGIDLTIGGAITYKRKRG